MRSFEGQRSDSMPTRRTPEEKRRMLVQLKEQLVSLKPTAAPAIRDAIRQRITALEEELSGGDKRRS
jgi:hypothetical protein